MSFVLPPFANATTNKDSPTREMNTLFNKFRQNLALITIKCFSWLWCLNTFLTLNLQTFHNLHI